MVKFAVRSIAQTHIFMDGFYYSCLRNLNQVICQRGVTSFGYRIKENTNLEWLDFGTDFEFYQELIIRNQSAVPYL